jgi:hypothetical protein
MTCINRGKTSRRKGLWCGEVKRDAKRDVKRYKKRDVKRYKKRDVKRGVKRDEGL